MSQSHPVSNPFGAGPMAGGSGSPNPFQIVGGSSSPAPSPFETAASQPSRPQVPPARQSPPAEAPNPFQMAPNAGQPQAPQQQPPSQAQQPAAAPYAQPQQQVPTGQMAPQPHATGGFEMTGLPAGGPPVNQVDPAPVGGGDDQTAPTADPFAGMDLPQISEDSGGDGGGEEPTDFAAVAEPEPEAEAEAKPEKPASKKKKSASFVPIKPTSEDSITSETKQLELRAIFGVDHELSAQEILQRARGLAGIQHVAKVSVKEAAALETLYGCASKLGLEDDQPIVMSCPEGIIDFLQADDTALAVLRADDYKPGVRATLLILARELGKL